MSLQSGQRLGQYEVFAKLGEGGMGEVYRAKDTTLGRDVALKVLPASVAGDSERLQRFEREAKLLASLSHANIATLHALERFDNRHVLVMELAPGEDLSTRIARGPMPLDEALPIAIQIAHALEAAHERGVIHRDLKPANIKVSEDGAVKVLDFGLAKIAEATETDGGTERGSAENSPTLTAAFAQGYGEPGTQLGVILGTAAYMSPEQARGRTADKRADIWAFGAILFEMLTGTRLFEGETISDTLAAVLRQDMPWARLPASTPNELGRLLRRLLERDRKNRLHDIADARLVLEDVTRGGTEEAPAPVAAPAPSRSRWLFLAAAGLVLIAGGAALGRYLLAPAPAASAGTIRLIVPMPPGVTNIRHPAVSPDGRFVAFIGQAGSTAPKLYLHYFNAVMPRVVEGTDGAMQPFVSPESRWIGFRRNNRLERISVDGGQPMGIADASTGGPSSTWLPGGPIVFAASWLGGLSAVSPEGGDVRSLTTLNTSRNEIGHWFPSALPDGRHVLFTVWLKATGLDDAEVALLDVRTRTYRILFKGAEPRYVAPGAIVFFRAGTYQAIRFDLDSLEPSGDPVRVLDDARGNIPEGGNVHTDIAAHGTVAYESTPAIPESRLVWVSPGGGLEELPFPVRRYGGLSLASDGRRIAVDVLEAGRYTIRLLELGQRPSDNPIDLPALNWGPVWHPDGKRLAFIAMRKGDFDAYWKDVTSTAAAEPLLVTDADDLPEAFSDDGRTLIFEQSEPDGTYPLKRMSVSPPGKPELVLPDDSEAVVVSPDNNYIAYVGSRTGEVYVLPLVGGGVPERVSTGGGEAVAWSANSREVYYARPPEIVAVTLGQEGPRLRPMGERVWARVNQSWPQQQAFAIGKDGRILIALPKEPVIPQIRVILNWDKEVAQKLKR